MANWSRPCFSGSEFLIQKDDVTINLKGGVVQFFYYESLFSPTITANLNFIDTGNSYSSEEDTQGRYSTVFSSLPIRGDEQVRVTIVHESGTLDFDDYPFHISSFSTPAETESKQLVSLSLCSEFGIKNENVTVYKKYYNTISDSVRQILTNELEIPSSRLNVESTSNSYAFTGSSKRPFDLILSLAPKSIPSSGSPGFFFWETQQAFNFKSIDSLISSSTIADYTHSNVATLGSGNNYRILSFTRTKNQDILSALRAGVYKTKNVFFNPYNFDYEELYIKLSEIGIENLGNEPEYPDEFESGTAFTRTHHFILDTGNMEVGVSTSTNNNPKFYQAASVMRYNLLFTQILEVVVPCNVSLKAGNIINCYFTVLTGGNPSEGIFDESVSGKYLILHLAHKFTLDGQLGSTTHLTLVRDTYGLYTSGAS